MTCASIGSSLAAVRQDAQQRVGRQHPLPLQQDQGHRDGDGNAKHPEHDVDLQEERQGDSEQRRMGHGVAEIGHAPPHDETPQRPGHQGDADAGD